MKILIKLCLITIVLSGWQLSASAQRRVSTARMSPAQLVADLYRQHKKQSPFFQHKNRALVDRYFDKKLADLLWNMPNSPDEVGLMVTLCITPRTWTSKILSFIQHCRQMK